MLQKTSGVLADDLLKVENLSGETSGLVETSPSESIWDGVNLQSKNKYKEATNIYISYLKKHPKDQAVYVWLYNCYNDETAEEKNKIF